jgi:O-antigen/teichoic acid export membrane protein
MPVFIELFKYGVPLSIGNLSDFIIKLSDRYIIGLYRSSFEVGLYNASYLIAENSIVMIYNLITKPAYPLLVHLWEQEGKEAVQEFLNKTTFYYLLIAFPASLGLSVLAKPVVEIFTGPSYHEGYKIIPFVTFGAFFLGLQWWARAGLLLYKKTRMVMYGVIFGSILNIILNIILVPKYGYMAAACTTLLSYVSVFLYMTFISQKFLPWKFPFKSFVKIIFASSIMAISVNFLSENFTDSKKINLFSSIFIGIIIYFLIIFFLKELNFKEIKSLFNKYSGKDGKIWQ